MKNSTHQATRSRRSIRTERGFSLIEVMLAVIALTVVGGVVARSVVTAASGRDAAEEQAAATEGARGMADRIEATDIDALFARFGKDILMTYGLLLPS